MKFIKHALIGIALYEAVKYILKREDCGFNFNQPDLTRSATGDDLIEDDDPWKNSLANDELRAPDS